MDQRTRRGVLQWLGALSAAGLAGCAALSGRSPTPTRTDGYDHLEGTATYVADDVGLRLPETVPRVQSPDAADLVVLHGNPATDAETAVAWLADGRRVALLGDRAQRSWLDWTGSEAYRDAYGDQAGSQADPAPHLLVAGAVDAAVTTSRYSWSDLPSNDELVASLDDALGAFATRTPD